MSIQKQQEILHEIHNERCRQIVQEGWTPEHDDEHEAGALASAAACYAHTAQFVLRPKNRGQPVPQIDIDSVITSLWPFEEDSFKPKTPRRDLIRAAALILAEIERIDRATVPTTGEPR